jgi:hypothetical protein
MAEPSDVFKVWIAFLAACGPDGVARVSAVFISSVCRLDPTVVRKAITRLEAPDPDSRSEAFEGRRIKKVDGGWFIVNYEKYRAFKYSEESEAVRKREYRRRKKEVQERDNVPTSPGRSASASTSDLTKDIEEIKRGWNEFAAKHNLATITKIDLGSERGRHLAARMAEKDWDFPKLLGIVNESPFLLGKKGREPFFVTFDWLLWPGNYLRTMEGNYLERGKPAGPPLGTWLQKMKEKEAPK